ncbi:MAG: DUF5916 domain-containing protein, partial [Proteobacteria bacterium]|nr:DUF5916 domain-containing protein [Pseudomonadota bacterium]
MMWRFSQDTAAALILLVWWGFSAPFTYAAGETGAVVFGSYKNVQSATGPRVEILNTLGTSTELVPLVIDGVEYHRLMTPAMPATAARELIGRAKVAGLSAWYLKIDLPPAEAVTQAADPAPADSAVAEPAAGEPNRVTATTTGVVAADAAAQVSASASIVLQGSTDEQIVVPHFDEVMINLDGHVDEAVWQSVPAYDGMRVIDPDTLDEATYSTLTRFVYTRQGLYISAVMEQPRGSLVARLSSRDQYLNRDAYGVTLDTSGEGLYGYWFVVNLGGSLMDGKVLPERTVSEEWDGPWTGVSAVTENGWSTEIFLPWSMMAIPEADAARKMGVWIDRKVAHMDERYGWPALPYTAARFMSALQPVSLEQLETKQQFAIFPYVSATHDEAGNEQEVRAGADISWRPSTNLQITATLNPDFGAVESDNVVVNLTAFETFFPEKRLFFLEGNEVFVTTPRQDINRFQQSRRGSGARATPSTFTPEPTTLLNTRRIGGPPKHLTVPADVLVEPVELGKPTDLLGAVKVVGSAGGLRYGVLAAFEDEVEIPGIDKNTLQPVKLVEDGRDFGVVRAMYETVGETRKAIGYMGTLVTLPGVDSSTHGIDTHLLSSDGKIKWDTQFMYSDVDNTDGYGGFTDISYTQKRGLLHRFSLDYVDKRLDVSDLGFIRQNDYIGGQYGFVRSTSQGLDYFRFVRNSLFFSAQTNTEGYLTRMGIFTNQTVLLPNNSQFRLEVDYYPERWDDRNSRGNGMFKTDSRWFVQVAYGTDAAKPFAWSGTLGAEQEELNHTWTYSTDLGFTYTPNSRFSIDLDATFKKRDGWLVHRGGTSFTTYKADDLQPRLALDYFFTARQQFRITLQWAGIKAEGDGYWQVPASEGDLIPRVPTSDEDFTLSRLTAQVRYRWEIGPLSDLFVVYTRGSNLVGVQIDEDFDDLFSDAV